MPNIEQKLMPNNSQSDTFGGPNDLATVTARPPALFLPEPKASERLSATGTPGAPTIRRHAGSLDGVKETGCTILRA
jgi:hypothetical protein